MKIGVTGVGGAAGVVVSKYLKREGFYIVGMDADRLSAGFKFCDVFYTIPLATDSSFIDKLSTICKKESIDILIPTVDEELLPIAENKSLFEDIHVTVIISEANVIKDVLDKYECYKKLKKINIPVPKTWLLKEVDTNSLEYPVVVKPRKGRGSRGVFICENQNDLEYALKKLKNPIIQEYICGKEYTIDTLSDFSGKPIVVIPRERIEIKGGVSWKGRTVKNENIVSIAMKLLKELKFYGPTCIQAIVGSDNTPKIIEINPRFGGTTSLTIESGVNTPLLAIKLALGQTIEEQELIYKPKYIARYFEDVFFEPEEVAEVE